MEGSAVEDMGRDAEGVSWRDQNILFWINQKLSEVTVL